MSVSTINSTLSSLLLQSQASQTVQDPLLTPPPTAATTSGDATGGWDSAYQLSLGQQADQNSLIGYNQLSRLVRQAGDTLGDLVRSTRADDARIVDGRGQPLAVDSFGPERATKAAQTLADAVNALFRQAGQMSGGEDTASADDATTANEPAATLVSTVQAILERDFGGQGTAATLAGIGIAVGKDGTVQVDTAALQSAYAGDPEGTRTLLAKAARALHDALGDTTTDTGGADGTMAGQIALQMRMLTRSLTQTPSLADVLSTSDDSSGTDSVWTPTLPVGLNGQTAYSSRSAAAYAGASSLTQTPSRQSLSSLLLTA